MNKLLFIITMLFLGTVLFAQEMPKDIKRYDYKKVGNFQRDTYTVMVITDCITNEKEYKLRVSYSVEFDNGKNETKVLYLSDSVVTEMIKAFSYLTTAKFGSELEEEETFIICDVGEGVYFKFRPNSRRLEVLIDDNQVKPCIYDVLGDEDDIYNDFRAKKRKHVLSRIDEYEMIEYEQFLQDIEKVFAKKGRDLKDAVILEGKKEPVLIQL